MRSKILALLFVLLATLPISHAVADYPQDMYLRQGVLGEVIRITKSGENNSIVYTGAPARAIVTVTGRFSERDVQEILGGQATLVIVRNPSGQRVTQKYYLCFGRDADCAEVVDLSE